jgi:hypothetical protein|tara:strand:+ start:1026 stop:1505 length:480 start_codon:yes stop_codon:yes gene_type:complete
MIQAITETNLTFYLQTEDNRIDTSVASSKIRHLVKFTNDMDKSILYAYSTVFAITDRYTTFSFTYNATPDVYTGDVKFLPAGHYTYEVYEVSWTGAVAISAGNAPVTEDDVLPVGPTHGVVQGLVTKGIMYVAEKDGTQQVQYTQREEPSGTNYIYYGQ